MRSVFFSILLAIVIAGCSSPEENEYEKENISNTKPSNDFTVISSGFEADITEKGFVYSVNLSEIEDPELLKEYFKIDSIHQDQNELFLSKGIFGNYLYRFIHTGILNNNINKFEFYETESYPKLSYWEYIINQLPSFVDYGFKYDSYSEEYSEEGKLFAFLAYRIDRSPENVNQMFDTYKEFIYSEIDSYQYRERGLETYIQYLITTYDYITSLKDYKILLNDISDNIEIADLDESIFIRAKQEEIYESIYTPWKVNFHHDALWFYSFWLRRYQEENMFIVYSILKEIDAHYYNAREEELPTLVDDGVIYTGSGNWEKMQDCEIPEDVVVGGFEPGRNFIVCRAEYADGIHPGKLVDCSCIIGYGDLEIVSDKFEILVGNDQFRWVNVVNCDLPAGAIRGGIEGERYLVVCRANYEGGLHPGKVVDCKCNIGFVGKEIQIDNYEVLVKK